MFELFFMTLSFLGLVWACCRFLNMAPSHAPLFAISLVGILLFFFALMGILQTGTFVIAGFGGGFCFYFIVSMVKNYDKDIPFSVFSLKPAIIFGALVIISFFITLKMQFTVVDDFVFWGIIGKYLVLFHQLPQADTTIIARHLTYTPGTSLIHYFFHALSNTYLPSKAYFAQSMILISALFVVIQKQQMEKSLIRLCLMVFLLTLFFGSVFIKLQVDYLLSAFFFAVLWIYYTEERVFLKLLTISAPIIFLFLIKQIGFVLGLLLLIIIFLDLVFYANVKKNQKIKTLGLVVLIAGFLLFLNRLWSWHCLEMGFTAFNNDMTLDNIYTALTIFSNEMVQKGFLIYLKGISLGPADRFNLPYVFWYVLLFFLWVRMFKQMKPEESSRYSMLVKILTISFLFYLVMIYFFQIIVFKVGAAYDHPVGLTRYLNICFAPMMIFTLLISVGRLWWKGNIPLKTVYTGVMVVMLVLGISRAGKKQDKIDMEAEQLARNIVMKTDRNRQNHIYVVPGIRSPFLGIKLLYHLLPDRVDHDLPLEMTQEQFKNKIGTYEYVLLHHPDNRVKELAGGLFTHGDFGFYRVAYHSPGLDESAILKKIF